MSYSLVLSRIGDLESSELGAERNVGENVLLAELPLQYQCYAFYYPGPMPDPQLEKALRALGEQTGQNLFVNIGRLNDPADGKITRLFGIKRTPVIVLTAVAPLAALEDDGATVYVRLDSSSLLDSTERTTQCRQRALHAVHSRRRCPCHRQRQMDAACGAGSNCRRRYWRRLEFSMGFYCRPGHQRLGSRGPIRVKAFR